jgi:hypothetical protein
MDKEDGDWPYGNIIRELREQWEAALDQVRPPGDISEPGIAEELDEWLDGLWQYLDERRKNMKYPGENWKENGDWPDKLRDGQAHDIPVNGEEELRDVLNAAWQCRIDHQTNIEEIADAAWALWEHIAKKRAEPALSKRSRTTATAAASGHPR